MNNINVSVVFTQMSFCQLLKLYIGHSCGTQSPKYSNMNRNTFCFSVYMRHKHKYSRSLFACKVRRF